MSINDDFRDLRVALGLSLREAADLLVMTPVALGRVERSVDGAQQLTPHLFHAWTTLLLGPHRERVRGNQKRLLDVTPRDRFGQQIKEKP